MPWYKNPEIWVPFAIFILGGIVAAIRHLIKRFPERKTEYVAVGQAIRMEKSPITGSNVAVGDNIQQVIHNHPSAPLPKSALDFPQTKPTPDEIAEYVEKLTPYEQSGQISVYNGVKVSWLGSFSDIIPYGADFRSHYGWDTDVMFFGAHRPKKVMLISCGINIEEAPRFKSLKRGTKVGIKGTISDVSSDAIRLKNPEFTFFEL